MLDWKPGDFVVFLGWEGLEVYLGIPKPDTNEVYTLETIGDYYGEIGITVCEITMKPETPAFRLHHPDNGHLLWRKLPPLDLTKYQQQKEKEPTL